jgi:hypothetical protein
VFVSARVSCLFTGTITVSILKLQQDGKTVELYQTDQRNLFSKYADRRCVCVRVCVHSCERACLGGRASGERTIFSRYYTKTC